MKSLSVCAHSSYGALHGGSFHTSYNLPSYHSQFARVVKGVDLRSTAGKCAWVQIPQGEAMPAHFKEEI